jgi:hypothetical protein
MHGILPLLRNTMKTRLQFGFMNKGGLNFRQMGRRNQKGEFKDGKDKGEEQETLSLQGNKIETEMKVMREDGKRHIKVFTTIPSRSETYPLTYIELVREKGLFTNLSKLFRKLSRPRVR